MRAGCSTLLRVCEDEHRLYYHFFSVASPLLYDLTERLCRVLYDLIRPRLIHIAHMETLAELCTIVRQEMLNERCGVIDADDPTSDTYVGFGRVANELAGDLSERLVHRALIYAQTDIGAYNPAPGDLAYPDKLVMMQAIAASQPLTANSAPDAVQSAVDLHALWYPTVRRTVVCLSKIFKCLDVSRQFVPFVAYTLNRKRCSPACRRRCCRLASIRC